MNKLIVILGPTATGKSELAIKLAKQFSGEIISADSRQIYKKMNIGTAKIKASEMQGIPHYLISILKPDQNFTLAEYQTKATKLIKKIQQKNKLPFLVGGTGLYIQSIVDNLSIPKVKPDKKLRNKLEKLSNQELYLKLKKIDPEALDKIDLNNQRRLIRALEVCLKSKQPFSQQKRKNKPLFNILQIGLKLDFTNLEEKIAKRTEQMIKQGLVQEVENLLKKYSPNLPALNSIGYQEIIEYLNNQIDLAQAKNLINLHTQQYAKRQMTWFSAHGGSASGGNKRINWIKNYKQAKDLIKNFLKNKKAA